MILKNRVAIKRGTEYLSIDLIPSPFLVLQPDGRIVDANKHCFALLGNVVVCFEGFNK